MLNPKLLPKYVLKCQRINTMTLIAPWAGYKTNKYSQILKYNKQPKFALQNFCKGLTQWTFVLLGMTIKTNNSSPTHLANTYLYNLKL